VGICHGAKYLPQASPRKQTAVYISSGCL